MIRVGIVGVGYWGPNLARSVASIPGVELAAVCDFDSKKASQVAAKFAPRAKVSADMRELAQDPTLDAVIVSTPIRTHFEIGQLFLSADKHVLIEKPLASSSVECQRLMELSEAKRRVLMVGHVFEYNVATQRVKEYLDRGDLGDLFYVYSQRVNLGRIQRDINALWSFAPHDISILNYWLGKGPVRVSARGFSYLSPGVEDVVFVALEYPGGVGAHLHLGWLDPRKVRSMTLVGSKKMVVYDDVSADAKIQVFDKGIENLDQFLKAPQSYAEFQMKLRTGDLQVPSLPFDEPLVAECRHFVDCIRDSKRPRSDGASGERVVKVLEAAQESMRHQGKEILFT